MSFVHLVMPSKRPASEVNCVMADWRERGYHIVLQRDPGDEMEDSDVCEIIMRPYAGYPEAVNFLAKRSLTRDPECQWVVAAGDDTKPDMAHTADEIAAQCSRHFFELALAARAASGYGPEYSQPDRFATFGVMQPTGDRWGDEEWSRKMWPDAPAYIDRICGSPWLGRSFCERINQGTGPLWHEYFHNWADEELQNVALKLRVLWQRRDLIHYHDHSWRRNNNQWEPHQVGYSAEYLRTKPLFDARKAAGFPGSEPL